MAKKYKGVYFRPELGEWWVSVTHEGKRLRRRGGDKQDKARDYLGQLKGELRAGKRPPQEVRFERAVEIYKESRTGPKGNKAHSYTPLDRHWLPAFKGRTLRSITSVEIADLLDRWQKDKKWKPGTRDSYLAVLAGLFSFAVGRDWLDRHPTEKGRVEMLRPANGRERTVTEEEYRDIREKADPWLADLLTVLWGTGMRRGEIISRTRGAVHETAEGRAYLAVAAKDAKGKHTARYWLAGDALAVVRRRLQETRFDGDLLLPGPLGFNAYTALDKAMRRAVEAAGLKYGANRGGIGVHTFRHSFATRLAESGAHPQAVQKAGNWKDQRMVQRYTHLSDAAVYDAVAGLDDGHETVTRIRPRSQVTGK